MPPKESLTHVLANIRDEFIARYPGSNEEISKLAEETRGIFKSLFSWAGDVDATNLELIKEMVGDELDKLDPSLAQFAEEYRSAINLLCYQWADPGLDMIEWGKVDDALPAMTTEKTSDFSHLEDIPPGIFVGIFHMFKRHRFDGEVTIEDSRVEANEKPRIVECYQLLYGKPVTHIGGPILRGSEHVFCAHSKEIASFLDDKHQIDLDKFFQEMEAGEYASRERGLTETIPQFAKKIIELNGRLFVVCAKSKITPEGGYEKPRSRGYTCAHYLLIPLEHWSAALIPQLNDALEPRGSLLSEMHNGLPPIELNTRLLDEPLPDNWFDNNVQCLLANIISGQNVPIAKTRVNDDDFMKQLFYATICLPESIGRALSFGSNLYENSPGGLRVAHTFYSDEELKMPKQFKRHIECIEKMIRGAKTPREVMQKIHAAQLFLGEKFERERLERIAKQNS